MISKQAHHSAENPTNLSCNRSADDIEVVPEREGSFGWGRQVKGYHVGDFYLRLIINH